MRRWLLRLALVVVLLPMAVWAQSAPRIYWEHDGANLSRFEYVLDGGTPVSMGLPTPSGTTYSYELPALTAGTHTLVIQACNSSNVCTPAAAITVVKL